MTDGSKPGEARSKGPSIQDYLDRETREVPAVLRESAYAYRGSEDLPRERYYSREFFELEVERMWTRTWQMACREEEIPEVGDYVVYDVVGYSLIVMRVAADEVCAYYNACLHRGRMLVTEDGHCSKIRCPFHGFTWSLDGALTHVPCRWDFPHVRESEFSLPRARVSTWGGFVFVNLDPDAMPLDEYLAPLPAHFERWDFEGRYKAVHVAKVVDINWKGCIEAFIEGYHVMATHPEALPFTADANTQYDVYPEHAHVNRMITAFGAPSPHVEVSEADMAATMLGGARLEVGAERTAREILADGARARVASHTGRDFSDATDCEMLDALQYFVFPNFVPWGGYGHDITYRFRPVGRNPESTLLEVMLLHPTPTNRPRPRPVPMHLLGPDEPWSSARELGGLGPIFDQDQVNMPLVQRGLRAARKPGVTLGNYQESRIRDLHRTLDSYLARD